MKSTSGKRLIARDGFAMATTLLIILVLSVIAVGASWLATTEKRTSFAESAHISSIFSADAGGESGINFLRLTERPPKIINFADSTVHFQGTTTLQDNQTFDYDCRYMTKQLKPGWGIEYVDYDYMVDSRGSSTLEAQSTVALIASRLYREGY
jgi:hypothetical protein